MVILAPSSRTHPTRRSSCQVVMACTRREAECSHLTHSVMVGATGSGKTVFRNGVIAETTHCCDALLRSQRPELTTSSR